ncbi:MAG: tyrosine-type recombinase/integrase [Solirubrobacteraceae bacterium]
MQQGQVFPLSSDDGEVTRWAYRHRTGGRGSKRVQRGGFATEQAAVEALERARERIRRERGLVETPTLREFVDVYLAQHGGEPETVEKLGWLLAKSVAVFGDRRLSQLRSPEIAAWRMTVPYGHRFEATQALRQVLNRAVEWGLIDINPAKKGVDNPQRRRVEKRPFESWKELEKVAGKLGRRYGPIVVFAAATGLRPGEWLALEWRDIDREQRVVYVRRSYRNGRIKYPKTEASMRAVPLQARALAALDAIPEEGRGELVFPSSEDGYFDLHNFRSRYWHPAQLEAGIAPVRRVYDLRHTFATFVPASPPSTSPVIWARA